MNSKNTALIVTTLLTMPLLQAQILFFNKAKVLDKSLDVLDAKESGYDVNIAEQEVLKKVREIAKDIGRNKNAHAVIIEDSNIFYLGPSSDITQEVIAWVNASPIFSLFLSEKNPQHMLIKGVFSNNIGIMEEAIQAGADVNAIKLDKLLIEWAIKRPLHFEVVRCLLRHGARVEKSLLDFAIQKTDLKNYNSYRYIIVQLIKSLGMNLQQKYLIDGVEIGLVELTALNYDLDSLHMLYENDVPMSGDMIINGPYGAQTLLEFVEESHSWSWDNSKQMKAELIKMLSNS